VLSLANPQRQSETPVWTINLGAVSEKKKKKKKTATIFFFFFSYHFDFDESVLRIVEEIFDFARINTHDTEQ
jgi:hypothetical protein